MFTSYHYIADGVPAVARRWAQHRAIARCQCAQSRRAIVIDRSAYASPLLHVWLTSVGQRSRLKGLLIRQAIGRYGLTCQKARSQMERAFALVSLQQDGSRSVARLGSGP